MKIGRIIIVSLFILILVGSTACSLGQSAAAQTQVAVSKGDLTINGLNRPYRAEGILGT